MKPKPDFKKLKRHFKEYSYQYAVLILFSIAVIFLNVLPYDIFVRLSNLGKLIIIFTAAVLLFKIKNSAIFFASLFSFVLTFIFLASNNKEMAEMWSMAVYAFLLLGVLRSLFGGQKEFN